MNKNHSIGTRSLALLLCIVMMLSMLPPARVLAEDNSVAQIGETTYATLEDALAAVPSGSNAAQTTITLLADTAHGFDVGSEDGNAPQNVVLDLNGKTLTLAPAVGSAGTVTNGIRVLANSALTVKNGKVVCSQDAEDHIKVGIANYSQLKLENVELVAGPETIYSINNRGELTLAGTTKIADGTGANFQFAITNDPYNYIYTDVDAVVNCASSAVTVGSMQVERYERTTTNKGGIELNISAGSFGKIVEDGASSVEAVYNVTGGTVSTATAAELAAALKAVSTSGTVTIKLTADVTQSFDLGDENGTAPKSVVLDLNGHTLTLAPAVGSTGTVSSGIRVLANSALVIKNGKVVCSENVEDNIKVGIANYSQLKLEDVELVAGPVTIYSINNRGALVLAGSTTIADGTGENFRFAITNDPYNYIYTDTDASLTCTSGSVTVGSMQVERYSRSTPNAGGIVLNISAGTFGKLTDDGAEAVAAEYNITGGSFANDVTAFVADGYECVPQQGGTYQVQFEKLEQEKLSFEQEGTVNVIYSDGLTFENKAEGGSGTGSVTYEIVAGDAAEIPNATKPTLKVLKAGTVTIRATKAGNDTYVAATAEYTLVIAPAKCTASFTETGMTVTYGTKTYLNDTLTVSAGTGAVTYAITEGADIAAIDETTGELTFADGGIGQITVQATVAADERYESCTATYTLTVQELETPVVPYNLDSEKVGENGWFRSDVTLTAPEGYTVSTSNSLTDADWSDTLTYTAEGVTEQVIYLKNADGYITGQIPVKISIDKTAPANMSVEYAENTWSLAAMLGGNKDVKVTFHVTEEGSGIAKLEYSKDGETFEEVTAQDGKYTVSVAPEYRGQISFKVTDVAGWITEVYSDGKVLVVDAIAPTKDVAFEGSYETDEDGTIITDEETFKVIYIIKENHYDLLKAASTFTVTTASSQTTEAWPVAWAETSEGYTATLTFTNEDTYIIETKISDYSNTVNHNLTVVVDRTPSVLDVDNVTKAVRNTNGMDYFGGNATIRLTVNEENFNWRRATVEVTTKKNGKLETTTAQYQTSGVGTKWSKVNGAMTLELTYSNEDVYSVRVAYKESGMNGTTNYSDPYVFTIDKTAPNPVTVDYDAVEENWVSQLQKLFGFSKETVTVTLAATDALSGIHRLVYSIDGTNETTIYADQLKDNSYSFEIEPEYRGTIVATAYDMAEKSTTLAEQNTLVVDNSDPDISVGYAGAHTGTSEDAVELATKDEEFRILFTASDSNFDIRKQDPVILIREVGEENWTTHENVEWSEDMTTATVELPDDGLYEVKYQLVDWLSTVEKTVTVKVDRTGPAISTVYAEADNVENNIRYFKTAQDVQVVVEDANFDPEKVSLKVTKDGTELTDYAAAAAVAENWNSDGDTYTLKLSFPQEGIYTLEVTAVDTLENPEQSAVADTFVVDLSDPTELAITYHDGFAFLELIQGWFGFSNTDVTATLTAKDTVSGVDTLWISTDGRNFTEIEPDENGAYTYTMKAEFRDQLTLKVIDKAAREATLLDKGAVVVDSIAPNVYAAYSETDYRDYEGIYYSNADEFPVEIIVEDANYDLRAQTAKVTLNGVEQELSWNDSVNAQGMPYGSAVLTLVGEGKNVLTADFSDRVNPGSWTQTVVLDRTAPVMDIAFSGEVQNTKDGKIFFNADQTVTITIDEINFLAEEVVVKVTDRNGDELTEYAEAAKDPANWSAGNNLNLIFDEDGIYTLELSYTDLAGNPGVKKDTEETTYTVKFVVDTEAPAVEKITYSQKVVDVIAEALSLGFFKAHLDVTVTASDATAGVNTIHYSYIGTEGQNVDTAVNVTDSAEVDENGQITFTIDGSFYGTVTAWAVDYANLESTHVNVGYDSEDEMLNEIVVDADSSERVVTITPVENGTMYILDGKTMENLDAFEEGDDVVLYFKNSAQVTIAITEENFYADDYVIEVTDPSDSNRNVNYTQTEWKVVDGAYVCVLTMAEEGDYLVTVEGKDHSGNEMVPYASQRIVVDLTAPVIDVTYVLNENKDQGFEQEDIIIEPNSKDPWETTHYLNRPLTATITINEHNFRAEDVKILVTANDVKGTALLELTEDNVVKAYYDQGLTQNQDSEDDASKWSAFEGSWRRENDQYVIDLVFNVDANYTFAVEYTDLAGNEAESYAQRTFSIDNLDPVIIVEGIEDGAYYCDETNQTVATIKIQDHNLDAELIDYAITAKDAAGENVTFTYPDLHVIDNWDYAPDSQIWSITIPFNVEANYTLNLSYTDRSNRVGEVNGDPEDTEYDAAFTVDYNKPTDLAITYETPVGTFDENGKNVQYFDNATKVILSARDVTAGMMKFLVKIDADGHETARSYGLPADIVEIFYNANVEDINKLLKSGETGITADSVTYESGLMTVVLNVPTQFRGSFSFEAVDLATLSDKLDDNYVVVTDSKKPERTVELTPTQIIDRSTMKNFEGELTESSNVVLYYNTAAEIKFTLTEANFYATEPVFTINDQPITLKWTEDTENPGTYLASYTLYNDGDYVAKLTYTDRSGNVMNTYTSQRIVIDTAAPVVSVSYDNNDVKNTIGGREYYDNTRVATITVRDENFRADDVKITVISTDVTGAELGNSYAAQGTSRNLWSAYNDNVEWRRVDDTYVLKLTYAADANYTFDIEYQDLATNSAVYMGQSDYIPDVFTVDHTAPQNLSISYSMEFLDTILEGITFGFYDAQMTVTLRAEDVTAGIHRFVYSYINSAGVSGVNAGKTDQIIEESGIVYSNNGRTATATFNIPQSTLTNQNQFNGTVSFTAYDRSMNSATLADNERIVVDNISPTASVSYNEPVQTVEGVAYYAGSINATITINEANFYNEDVAVIVTRDGVSYPVSTKWTDTSVDIHVGQFTLAEEGDYVVTIRYADKSGNTMKEYVSGTMVIDLEAPTIHVSNVVANSANNDEVYTFNITVDDADANLQIGGISPVLSYIVRGADGKHTTEYYDLSDVQVVAAGKTYIYTIENLTADAIYTLSCGAKDLAGNAVDVMILDDGTAESVVRFSINRNGSTFEYGDDNTSNLASQYYVQNVNHDLVINEINVDPVDEFAVTVNGKTLVNGVDYMTKVSGGGDTWSVRTYTIKASLFAEEGEYNVVVSSVDATNTTAFSDMKNLNMAFVVDRTEPTVVLGGLEEGGRYQNTEQIVTLIPSDEGGQLSSVQILLFPDGADPDTAEPTKVLFDMSGEELMEYLKANGGVITFKIPEGYQHTVRIICSDYAQGEGNTVNERVVTYTNVTVSPDALVIFFANKPAFYGTIFGLAALLLFIFFLIFKRKKREDEEKTETKE